MNEVVRPSIVPLTQEMIVGDKEDFKEFKELYNKGEDEEEVDNRQFYDIKRIMIQEKGEEDY